MLPTPYYQDDFVTIYHGDCREIVPLLGHFDLLLTDPPYGIGRSGQTATSGGHGGRKGYTHKGWDDMAPDRETLSMLMSHADKHVMWGANYYADRIPASGKWLVWDKGQRINQSDCELAYTSLDGALRVKTMNRVEIARDGAVHPTQKPENLMAWCIQQVGGAGSILDPYAGSGTVGRVAKSMGIRCVLIEVDSEYIELAAARCRQEVLL